MTVSQKRQGLLFILIGPGGAGKNAIMNPVLDALPNLSQLAIVTTRQRRPGEEHGRERLFVSHTEFQQMIEHNALLEYEKVHDGDYYGVPRAPVETAIAQSHDLIADIDVKGAMYLRSILPDNVILTFVAPPSLASLEARMQERGDPPAAIEARLRRAQMEMTYQPFCDYLIVNDNLKRSISILKGIILAERSRRDLLNLRVEKQLPRRPITYAASLIPVHNGTVLYQEQAPHFPITNILRGELPHEAALRAFTANNPFNTTPASPNLIAVDNHQGEFLQPVTITSATLEHQLQVVYIYLYQLEKTFDLPFVFRWLPPDEANLPEPVINAVASLQNRIIERQ